MNEYETELLSNLRTWMINHDPDHLLDRIYTNEGGMYNGYEFLMEVSRKLPLVFQILLHNERTDIPPEIYVNAIIYSEGGHLFNSFRYSSHLEGYLNFDKLFPLIIEKHWNALNFWQDFRNDEYWVEKSVSKFYGALQFASESLKDSTEFVTKLILKNPSCFKYASDNVRNDRKIALLAVILEPKNFPSVGKRAALDFEICYHAMTNNPNYIQLVNPETTNYDQLVEKALTLKPDTKSLLPRKIVNIKSILDQITIKANLELAYGATPPRISNLKESETYLQRGNLKITLISQGKLVTFRLPISEIKHQNHPKKRVNINLKNNALDSNKFIEWQKSITEVGALKIVIKNVGIE